MLSLLRFVNHYAYPVSYGQLQYVICKQAFILLLEETKHNLGVFGRNCLKRAADLGVNFVEFFEKISIMMCGKMYPIPKIDVEVNFAIFNGFTPVLNV